MVTLLLALALQDDVFPLEPETGPFVGFKECYQEFALTAERPPSVTKAPEGKLSYLVFPWGEGKAVVAIGDGKLWPDRDGDGDLAEETPIAHRADWSNPTLFPLSLTLGKKTIEARIQMRTPDGGSARLTNLTRMSGEIPVGGRTIQVSLTDFLVNGRYDDYYTTNTLEYWLCDHVQIDLDGDGEFKDRIPPKGEDYSMARAFILGEAVYGFEVLDRGERLRFQKRDTKLVSVQANVPEFEIDLLSDEYGSVRRACANGTLRIPAGSYQFVGYDYRLEGYWVDGLAWKSDGIQKFEIQDGLELTLKGEMRYELFDERQKDGSYRLWTICFGPNGERVEIAPPGARNDNFTPILRVATEKGEELWSVRSNYC